MQNWANQLNLTYPILMDPNLSVWNQYGMGYIPHNVVIDPDTIVRYTNYGYEENTIKNVIESYLPTEVAESHPPLPKRPVLLESYPNPFRTETQFVIQTGTPQEAWLTIYNLKGERVARFPIRTSQTGVQTFHWNGQTERGAILPSGMYIAVLKTRNETKTIKILKVR